MFQINPIFQKIPVQCRKDGKISLPERPKSLPKSEDYKKNSNAESKRSKKIQDGKLSVSIETMIITNESFLNSERDFPKIYDVTLSMFSETNGAIKKIPNQSSRLLLKKI